MVFNETTTPFSGVIQNIERETKLGLGVISDNASPDYYLAYFLGKVNEWLHIVTHWIHEINDEWGYDDSNNTGTIPEEYSFTDNLQTYTLDTDITKIRLIEARDAVTEEYYNLDYYYEKDRIEDLYNQDSGKPTKYFIQGRSLITDIPVDTAKVDKYRITYDRHAHEFAIDDTTAVPGFDKQFHWLLVYGPTMDWTSNKDKDLYNKCYLKIFGKGEGDPNALKTMLQDHYFKQNENMIYKIGREKINYS